MSSVTAEEASEEMTDEVAATFVKVDESGKVHTGKKGIVNVDVLSANFNDGDVVTVEALLEKGLIPASVSRVKLLAKGTLNKKLNVALQDYSLEAVKMIVLVGGTVKKVE